MESIKLISHGETIEFTKAHADVDTWKAVSSNGTVTTDWTTTEVKKQVSELKERGFVEPKDKDKI